MHANATRIPFGFGKEGIVKLCIKILAQMKKMVYACERGMNIIPRQFNNCQL